MTPTVNVHDMVKFTRDLEGSYQGKVLLHKEYWAEAFSRGFASEYSRDKYVREKFPKFPIYLRKRIASML